MTFDPLFNINNVKGATSATPAAEKPVSKPKEDSDKEKSFFSSIPIIIPPLKPEKDLSAAETNSFLKEIFGKEDLPSDETLKNYSGAFVNITNQIVEKRSSAQITDRTRAKVLEDPVLKDTLRLVFLSILHKKKLKRNKLAKPHEPATELEKFASTAAAEGSLSKSQLSALRNGFFNLEIAFATDKKNQVTAIKVILKIGTYSEVVGEYKDGKIVPGKSALATATITYLQNLLIGAGYLNPKIKKGEFCKQTLTAFHAFQATENLLLISDFNVKDTIGPMLEAKIKDAKEAYDKYKAVEGTGDKDRYFKYKLAEKALDQIYNLINLTKRYQEVLPENLYLSAEEAKFLEDCKKATAKFKGYAKEIFAEILKEKDGFYKFDIRSLKSKIKEARKHKKRKKAKKAATAFMEYVDATAAIISKYSRWQELAKDDLKTPKIFEAVAKLLTRKLKKRAPHFPGSEKYVAEKLQLFGKALEEAGKSDATDAVDVKKEAARLSLAAKISDELGSHAARGLILAFLKQSIEDKGAEDAKKLFSAFLTMDVNVGSHKIKALASYYTEKNIAESIGSPVPGKSDYLDNLEYDLAVDAGVSKEQMNRAFGLATSLYSLIKEQEIYADSAAGKKNGAKKIDFVEIIKKAQEILKMLEGVDAKDTKEILGLLANSSNNHKVARLEFNEALEAESTKAHLKNNKDLNANNTLKLTPRVIQALEKKFAEASVLPGAVSYGDIKKWNADELPAGAKEGDYFHVSIFGVHPEKVDPAKIESGTVKTIPMNNLSGLDYSRNPIDFVRIEKLASLKLSAAKYAAISDKQVLMLTGKTTARINDKDLLGFVKIYGEGKHWIFRPGTLQFKPVETAILNKIADTIEGTYPEKARLIRKVLKASAKTRFTAKEIEEIKKIFSKSKPEVLPNLDPFEKKTAKAAFYKVERALKLLHHKQGLNETKQKALKDLAEYLSWDESLFIYDGRLKDDEPSAALLKQVKEAAGKKGKEFVQAAFKDTYREAIKVLRELHGALYVLASKYPPEPPGWHGTGSFIEEHYGKVFKAMWQSVAAPSPADFLVVGLPNDQVFETNAILYGSDPKNSILKKLADIQKKLNEFDKITENKGLKNAVDKCAGLSAFRAELVKELKELKKSKKLKKEYALKGYISEFLHLAKIWSETNKEDKKVAFVYQVTDLLKMAAVLEAKVRSTLEAEKNDKKKNALSKMHQSLKEAISALTELKKTRDALAPEFDKKFDLETDRQDIIDKLSSDRFDNKKYELFKEKFAGLFEENLALDWLSGVFSGDQGIVIGPGGKSTKKTAIQILDEFFGKGGKISLSSLLPEPGEDEDVIIAKIALSKIFEKIPREQSLDLLKSLPVMIFSGGAAMHGVFSLGRDVPAIGSGAAGGLEVDFGSTNGKELSESLDPLSRVKYGFLSFLALSSAERPKMNMSAQLHLLLAGSPSGHDHLAKKLAGADPNKEFIFDTVTDKDVEAFIKYLKEEIVPQLKNNPRLGKQYHYLLETKRVAVDLRNYTEEDFKRLTTGLPKKFKLYDSFHSHKDMVELAKVLEDALKITGEINKTRAIEDIENYSISYFDPVQSVKEMALKYQDDDTSDPVKEVGVIRYNSDPKVGENKKPSDAQVALMDSMEWGEIHLPGFFNGLAKELSEDPTGVLLQTLKESGGFTAHFLGLMGKQIGMGFANTWGGVGDLAEAIYSGNDKKIHDALERISDGLAHTTGAFVVFESLPAIFFADVLKDIEAGKHTAALGKALAITYLTYKSMGVTFKILGGGLKAGWVTIKNGALYIHPKYRKIAYEKWKMEMREPFANVRNNVAGKLGFKLLAYHMAPPVMLASDGAKVVKKVKSFYAKDFKVEVRPSNVEISLSEAAPEGVPKGWEKVADFKAGMSKYKYGAAKGWRSFKRLFGAPRAVAELTHWRTSGTFKLDPKETVAIYETIYDIGKDPSIRFEFRGKENGSYARLELTSSEMIDIFEGRVPERLKGFDLANSRIKGPSGMFSIESLVEFNKSYSILKEARTNPGTKFSLTFYKGKNMSLVEHGGRPVEMIIDGETYLKLTEAKSLGEFKKIIKKHNVFAGHEYSAGVGTYKQLYEAFTSARVVYAEVKESLQAIEPTGGKPISEFELLREAAAGKGLGAKYSVKVVDPQTGQPKTVEVTGRNIVEILSNQSGKAVISPEVDAQIAEHFQKTVNGLDLHKLSTKAGKHIKSLGHHKYANTVYVKTKLDPGFIKKLFNVYKFENPMYKTRVLGGWRAFKKLLKDSPQVEKYAAEHETTKWVARKQLAKKLHQEYIAKRAEIVLEELDRGAKEHLSEKEYKAYKADGEVLKKGRIFGRKFQKVFAKVKGTIEARLAEFDASFKVETSLERIVAEESAKAQTAKAKGLLPEGAKPEGAKPAETPKLTPPPIPTYAFGKGVKLSGRIVIPIEQPVAKGNLQTTELRYVIVAEGAAMPEPAKLDAMIQESISNGTNGKSILWVGSDGNGGCRSELLTLQERVVKKGAGFQISGLNGQLQTADPVILEAAIETIEYDIKARNMNGMVVVDAADLEKIMKSPTIEVTDDMIVEVKPSEIHNWIDSLETSKAGKRYLKSVEKLARTFGFEIESPDQLADLLKDIEGRSDALTAKDMEKLMKKLTKRIEMLAKPEGKAWMEKTVEGREFAALMEEMHKLQNEAVEGQINKNHLKASFMGLCTGMVTILLADELADILGIDKPVLKFAAVLSSAHFTSKALTPLFTGKGREKALLRVKKMINKLPGLTPGKVVSKIFSKSGLRYIAGEAGLMLRGATQGVALATGYDVFFAAMGFEPDSVVRNPLLNMGITFGGMWAWQEFAAPRINKSPTGAKIQTAGGAALSIVGGVLLVDSLAFALQTDSTKNAYFTVEEKHGIPSGIPLAHFWTRIFHGKELGSTVNKLEFEAEKTWLEIEKLFLLSEKAGLKKDKTYYTKLDWKHADVGLVKKYFSEPVFLSKEMQKLAFKYAEARSSGNEENMKEALSDAAKHLKKEDSIWADKSTMGYKPIYKDKSANLEEIFDIYLMQQTLLSAYKNYDKDQRETSLENSFRVAESGFGSDKKETIILKKDSAEWFLQSAAYDFNSWNYTADTTKAILASRAEARVGELFAAALEGKKPDYDQTDVEMGFVVADGKGGYKLNEKNESFIAVKTRFYQGMRKEYLAAKDQAKKAGATSDDYLRFHALDDMIKSLAIELWNKNDETSTKYVAALTGTSPEKMDLSVDVAEIKKLKIEAETDALAAIDLAAKWIELKKKVIIKTAA